MSLIGKRVLYKSYSTEEEGIILDKIIANERVSSHSRENANIRCYLIQKDDGEIVTKRCSEVIKILEPLKSPKPKVEYFDSGYDRNGSDRGGIGW